jgi:hypothetical protein
MADDMSGAALAIALNAQAQADRVQRQQCEQLMNTGLDTTATVEVKRQYAECVTLLYPNAWESGELIVMRCWVALGLLGMIVGAVKLGREDGDWQGAMFGALFGALWVAVGGFVVVGLLEAVAFVVSGGA